ncbi:MAG: hypothetical protein OER92_02330 [Alphaproteobacteria bacterium]|nr:hypothetical protein [Alphaproteobacteria bacterium]
MRNPLKQRDQNMGRRPIHDEAMTPAERQRRRRARLRDQPWRDQRLAVRAILQALRDLQDTSIDAARLAPDQVAQIVDRAVHNLAPTDDAATEEARATVAKLLDPNEPLPERGHRSRRGRRGHRMGDGMRRRHDRRRGDNGEDQDRDHAED